MLARYGQQAYAKNARKMYSLIEENLQAAIKNAEKLLSQYAADTPPHQMKPATCVHNLVQSLLNYAPKAEEAELKPQTSVEEKGI